MKIKHIWDPGKHSFRTCADLVKRYNLAPTVRTEDEYRKLQEALPKELVSNIHKLESRNVNSSDKEQFPLTELYKVTVDELKSKCIYHRLIYMKLNGFEVCYAVLDKAGLIRTNTEEDQATIVQWWTYLKHLDLDHKTWQFQWKLSHGGLYTGTLLHQINPGISQTCVLCRNGDESLAHIFIKCVVAVEFWEWIFNCFNFRTILDEAFVFLSIHKELSKLSSFIVILGKATIWEMVGIARQANIPNTLPALKLNFRFKVQSQLNNLYIRYKYRSGDSFDETYLLSNVIVKNAASNNIRVQLNP